MELAAGSRSLALIISTLAITWPPRARKLNKDLQGAAQMYGNVSRFADSITDHLVEDRCSWQFATTSWVQSPRHHGMQRHSPDSLHVQESCEILTGALLSNQWTARLPALSWPWLMANCSCREWERKLDTDWLGLTIFKPICDNTKG